MGDSLADMDHLCFPAFSSLDNSLYQNPCQVAHVLFSVCDSPSITRDDYSLAPLDPSKGQHHYPAPNQWQATECICSMAGYNLVQACAACQQTTPILAVSWNDWVSNCTMSNINYGRTFPYSIPGSTALPNWAYANNAHGSFDMGDTFRRINNNASAWPFNPSSYSIATATSTSPSSSASTSVPGAYGDVNQGASQLPTNNGDGDTDDGTSTHTARIVVGVVIPVVVIVGLLVVAFLYVRRKKRQTLQQRGFRLGSDNNLPPPSFLVVDPSTNPFSDPTSASTASNLMTQQKGGGGIVGSLFLPSETVFTRTSNSRSSFTTNSVSTGSISAPPSRLGGGRGRRGGGGGLGRDPYGPRDSTSLFAPSTTTDYDSRSSAAYTYDDDEEEEEEEEEGYDDEDESISPFSDLRRPRPTRLASRNNVHNHSRYSARGGGGGGLMSETETDSMMSRTSSRSGAGGGRLGIDPDEESLITLSSRVSKLSRAAPSSSGATYGGAHDDEEDEEGDWRGSEIGDEQGFETEQGGREEEDEEDETEGYDTEQGAGFDTETGWDDDDAVSLNTTASTNHRP